LRLALLHHALGLRLACRAVFGGLLGAGFVFGAGFLALVLLGLFAGGFLGFGGLSFGSAFGFAGGFVLLALGGVFSGLLFAFLFGGFAALHFGGLCGFAFLLGFLRGLFALLLALLLCGFRFGAGAFAGGVSLGCCGGTFLLALFGFLLLGGLAGGAFLFLLGALLFSLLLAFLLALGCFLLRLFATGGGLGLLLFGLLAVLFGLLLAFLLARFGFGLVGGFFLFAGGFLGGFRGFTLLPAHFGAAHFFGGRVFGRGRRFAFLSENNGRLAEDDKRQKEQGADKMTVLHKISPLMLMKGSHTS
jgi:hypothetical protein